MNEEILVIGGAGFIGSHLVDALLNAGYGVSVYDNLDPQIHGDIREKNEWPSYLPSGCNKILGDVRDRDVLHKAVTNADIIFHLAASVGVGQSMYAIERYVDVNIKGTAILLDILANDRHHVRKLVVASSMSLYGEGKYHCIQHGEVYPQMRSERHLSNRIWELHCPFCDKPVIPLPTPEEKPLFPNSIYAITKRTQEEACLTVGRAYSIPTVALRYFNVYGSRQSLSNPYTGLISMFLCRLLNGQPPLVYEDGLQTRDFVHVRDIVQANLMAMTKKEMDYGAFNVGTGRPMSVIEASNLLLKYFPRSIKDMEVLNVYRKGDVRHCFANIDRIQAAGYKPQVTFEDGLQDVINYSAEQKPNDLLLKAQSELFSRGLTL